MTAGVTLQTRLSIEGSFAGSNDLGSPKLKLTDILESLALTPGTDATTKADLLFSDQRTIAASGNEDLDLAGSLSDAFGATITAAEILLIYIKAAAGNTNNVVVTVPVASGFVGPFQAASDGYTVKPGEFLFFQSKSGWAVTAGTGDLLNVANSSSGTGVTYDVVIVARSVAA